MKFGMVQYTVGHLLHAKFGPDQGREVGTEPPNLKICSKSHFLVFATKWRQYIPVEVKFGIIQ